MSVHGYERDDAAREGGRAMRDAADKGAASLAGKRGGVVGGAAGANGWDGVAMGVVVPRRGVWCVGASARALVHCREARRGLMALSTRAIGV